MRHALGDWSLPNFGPVKLSIPWRIANSQWNNHPEDIQQLILSTAEDIGNV